jgi:integrase/recombinase XerD
LNDLRFAEVSRCFMPPRRRPQTQSSAVEHTTVRRPGTYLEPFLQYLRAECGMSANTVKAYRTDLQQFLTWFDANGTRSLEAVDLKVLSAFLEHLRDRNLASSTIARRLVAIKMFFRFLVLDGVLAESTADLLSSPKLWQYLPTVLSPEAVDRLLAAPTTEDSYPLRDRAILAVLYATGCRASEVAGLMLQDVRLTEGFCRCLGKGNKERIVSLNPVATAALEAYLNHERPRLVGSRDCDTLFVTRTGRPMNRIVVWHLVKKYASRAGVSSKVSPHTLRHSFATHMLAGGAEIRALQELLGHASIRTTQIYTQVEHSRLKSIHARCHPRG